MNPISPPPNWEMKGKNIFIIILEHSKTDIPKKSCWPQNIQQPQKNISAQAQTAKNTNVKISEIKKEDLTE